MKEYTFEFYPNGHLAKLTVIEETKISAEKMIRNMIPAWYFDDGLHLCCERDLTNNNV